MAFQKLQKLQKLQKKDVCIDHHHNGIRQAGNKSMLSYGPSLGVPGYTGFIPVAENILIPTKDCAKHVEKTGCRKAGSRLLRERVANVPTTYGQMGKHPSPFYKVPKEEGGGWWEKAASRTWKEKTGPLSDTSIYKADMVHHKTNVNIRAAKNEDDHDRSDNGVVGPATGTSPSRSGHVASGRRSDSPETRYTETACHISDMVKRYRFDSAYTNMTIDKPLVGCNVAAGLFKSRKMLPPNRPPKLVLSNGEARPKKWRKSEHTQNPWDKEITFFRPEGLREMKSMYSTCHGVRGTDPLARSLRLSGSVSDFSDCLRWDKGTAKSYHQLPGYCGYMPSYNCAASDLVHSHVKPRPNTHQNMLLYELSQYPRGRLPGYPGFLPRAAKNVKLLGSPPSSTSYGAINQTVETELAKSPLPHSHFTRVDELLKFFSNGSSAFTSENGKANAEKYYHILRPKEGLPKIHYPAAFTDCGYEFPN